MKIDDTILKALQQATSYRGGQVDLARKAGLNKTHINHYLSGAVKNMELETWQKLAPHLSEYLPDNYISIGGNNNGTAQNFNGSVDPSAELKYKNNMTSKIINSDELDAETKIKVLRIINEQHT
eukprot:TRINITY_DN17296_c0_g1_i1.p3 TRINITY_DN17296_c0_g1~~TRINITY_DN17296_c0_g1_i1.p3  ORF type:complete len:124 (+),score=24.80 TRINITY_DN17296_c0_g1_i1:246-617(+)